MAESRHSEVPLRKMLGEDASSQEWQAFFSNYKLVDKANKMMRIKDWENEEYVAVKIRLQITGDLEQWINVSESAGEKWMEKSSTLIEKIKSRMEGADGIELQIKSFEDCKQHREEPIETFLTRLRKIASIAFSNEAELSVRSRVIWKFISNLENEFIRQEILRDRWMTDSNEPKEYAQILNSAKRAETLQKSMIASSKVGISVAHEASSSTNSYETLFNDVQSIQSQLNSLVLNQNSRPQISKCWYCHRFHKGGYKSCYKRAKENPTWMPKQYQSKGLRRNTASRSGF